MSKHTDYANRERREATVFRGIYRTFLSLHASKSKDQVPDKGVGIHGDTAGPGELDQESTDEEIVSG